jgi:hypothetical protein
VNLKIKAVYFVANLIILESMGIDVILGMDWLSKHKVLIDCAKKSIKLTSWMLVKDLWCQWSMSFPMSSPRNCQVSHLTETSSL